MVEAAGRADLVRALALRGEDALATAARLLGYYEEAEVEEVPPIRPVGEARIGPGAYTGPAVLSEMAPVPFWRLEGQESLEEPTKPQDDKEDVEVLSLKDLAPETEAPEPAGIVAWPRLWPALHRALVSAVPSHEIDADALVEWWCRGRPVHRLPYRDAYAWSRRVRVLVDRSRRLIPFWRDQDELCRRLRERLGRSAVTVDRGLDGPRDLWTTGHKRRSRGPSAAGPGETVLVLGDLGFYAGDEERDTWTKTARALRRQGARTRALVPCPASRWTGGGVKLWNGVDWTCPIGGGARAGPRPDDEELRRRCERLLAMVSPALRVEPGLLRAVRHLLPARDADAGTEADVYSHPDVDGSSSVAMSLDPAATGWREAFRRESPELRTAVVREIRRWHVALSLEIWLDEAMALLETGLGEDGTLSKNDAEAARDFALLLGQTVTEGVEDPRLGIAMEAFFVRFGGRRTEKVWTDPKLGRVLARAWRLVREKRPDLGLPPGVSMAHLVEEEAGEPRRWTVWQVGSALRFLPVGDELASGSPLATFWSARPFIGVAAGEGSWQERWPLGAEPWPLRPASAIVLTTDRARVELRRFVPPAWASVVGRDRVGLWATVEIADVLFRFRWIPPGRFRMGSPEDEEGRWDDEGPRHEVTLTRGFWLADTPCTQALWEVVMGENPSHFKSSSERPVEQVSWDDCQGFLKELNRRVPGLAARLPTEAEWEYACRAGTEASRYSPNLDKIAWYVGNSEEETHPVAQKEPNEWGLYDMLGNVLEWCMDYWRGSYDPQPATDPTGPAEGTGRVSRGGSWFDDARYVRAAFRGGLVPGFRTQSRGFRLARGQGEEG